VRDRENEGERERERGRELSNMHKRMKYIFHKRGI
jgi:hypothetical protein